MTHNLPVNLVLTNEDDEFQDDFDTIPSDHIGKNMYSKWTLSLVVVGLPADGVVLGREHTIELRTVYALDAEDALDKIATLAPRLW